MSGETGSVLREVMMDQLMQTQYGMRDSPLKSSASIFTPPGVSSDRLEWHPSSLSRVNLANSVIGVETLRSGPIEGTDYLEPSCSSRRT
jgi:hypothetical protein